MKCKKCNQQLSKIYGRNETHFFCKITEKHRLIILLISITFLLIVSGNILKSFTNSLNLMIEIIKVTTSIESKFILIILTVYINIKILELLVHIVIKINEHIKKETQRGEK